MPDLPTERRLLSRGSVVAAAIAIAAVVALGSLVVGVRTARLGLAPSPAAQDQAGGGGHGGLPARVSPARLAPPIHVGRVQQKRYLVLIVLDGARPDYFTVSGIPHIQALMRHGTQYSQAWAGILESETPSGHAALGTGSAPREDGILSFDWANGDNIVVDLFAPSQILNGTMEHILAASHAPSIAGLVHRAYPGAKVVVAGGHKYYAQDAMGGPQADVILYYAGTSKGEFAPTAVPGHVPPASVLDAPGLVAKSTHLPLGTEDHLAMKLAVTSFEKMKQQVTLINEPEFDWPLGHVDGANRDPQGVRTLMQQFDRDLAMLEDAYRKAGVLDRTEFVITADHGFAPITYTVSQPQVADAVKAAGTSILSDTYQTADYIWIKDETKAPAAAANIARLRNPYIQSVYFKETVPGGYDYVRATGSELFRAPGMEAANQYLLHSFNGPNAPDLVVFNTEETASLYGGQASWKGDHGGADWESQHIPLIVSGPGVRQGYVSPYPARLMDIAPTALTLLGVSPSGMTGTPLADAMQHPPASAQAAQRAQGSSLQAVVSALQAESRLELANRQ